MERPSSKRFSGATSASATRKFSLINNRQTGRRRGRGGQQPRGMSGSNNSGNRQDNRQRGNAAQLLEKYKSMARDSQLAGDRVQTEYYLQFADHYFRVLGDSRPRADEQQRRQRGDDDGYSDDDEQMDADNDGDNENDGDSDEEQPRHQQQRPRSDDQQQQRPRSDDQQPQRSRARPVSDRAPSERAEPRRERPSPRPRDDDDGRGRPQSRDNGSERIDFAVLPPAIGNDDKVDFESSTEVEAPRPKRRVRRPRADEAGSDDAAAS